MTSKINWQTGTPSKTGNYLITVSYGNGIYGTRSDYYHTEFEENLRGVFRTLYGMKCKNFFADGECLQGGRCDGNCPRMKNYDKKH